MLLAALAWASSAHAQTSLPPDRFVEVPVDRPWYVCPTRPDRNMRYYPEKAQRQGVEGMADIQCRFHADGSPEACVWLRESQPDYEFGPAAERLGCRLKMTREGEAAGKPFVAQMPLRFTLPRR